jgi:hypothetical protein
LAAVHQPYGVHQKAADYEVCSDNNHWSDADNPPRPTRITHRLRAGVHTALLNQCSNILELVPCWLHRAWGVHALPHWNRCPWDPFFDPIPSFRADRVSDPAIMIHENNVVKELVEKPGSRIRVWGSTNSCVMLLIMIQIFRSRLKSKPFLLLSFRRVILL